MLFMKEMSNTCQPFCIFSVSQAAVNSAVFINTCKAENVFCIFPYAFHQCHYYKKRERKQSEIV